MAELKIEHLDLLLLTHSHYDHAGNARKLKEKFHVPVAIHHSETSNLVTGDFDVPEGTTWITRFIVMAFAKPFAGRLKSEPCNYDFSLDNEFDLNPYGFNAYVAHTPGHSKGSVSIIIEDEIAVVGDAMFGIFKNSIMPPYAKDIPMVVQSWGKLLQTNCNIFLPAHGSAINRNFVLKNYNKRKGKFESNSIQS